MSTLVSIIIPVYNAERFVGTCIDSCLAQTHSTIEVICVNDGSRDRSAEILDCYAKADSRVKIIHKENGGVTSARNAGVACAACDFILFVDADDYLHPIAIQVLLDLQTITNADIAIGGQSSSFPHDLECQGKKSSKQIFSGIDYIRLLLLNYGIRRLCGKLIRKSLFASIFLPTSIRWDEDFLASVQLTAKAEIVAETQEILYCYIDNPTSVTKTKNITAILTQHEARNCICSFLQHENLLPQFANEWCCCNLNWELTILSMTIPHGYKANNLMSILWKCLTKDIRQFFFCLRNTLGIRRLCLIIALLSPCLAAQLLRYYGFFRMKMIKGSIINKA